MGINALSLSHQFLRGNIRAGQTIIDATAGNGGDTLCIAELLGGQGKILAFDIQEDAVNNTRAKLAAAGYSDIAEVILDSHANMDKYAAPESVDGIVFNFGWLPGGDHDIFTRKDSSIAAIEKSLSLLKPGGFMSLCVYYGRNNGYEERDAILDYIKTIDNRGYTVLRIDFPNRHNDPPFPIFIIKDNP